MEKFDVVVVGAGTGGSLAAKTAAKSGLKVCLVDVKSEQSIGRKICGDAIGRHHFDNLGLKEPAPPELECVMDGVRIHCPDKQTSYVVKGEKLYGYILNRHHFGQRLVKEAVNAGATMRDETRVLEPIVRQGSVGGVFTKSLRTDEKKALHAPITIEATGFFAAIRKKLKPELGIDPSIDNGDVEACYREIRRLRKPMEEPSLCQIYLTQAITPGGYYWIFPEGGDKANVGLGVAMVGKFPNPKEQLYKHVLSQSLFDGSSIVDKGTWYVPTRRPLDNMVGDGILIVGDAACQVNPIHGGGMGPSMIGGMLAGEASVSALEEGNADREGLWQYNINYMRDYGAKQAGLEIFRILLQNMDDEDLNFGMHNKLLTEEDLLKASMGEDAKFTMTEKTKRAFRGIKRLAMLRKLRSASKLMKEIKAWYGAYPAAPKDFEKWKAGVRNILIRTHSELKR